MRNRHLNNEVRISKIKTLSLAVMGLFLLVAVAGIAIPSTQALGWSLLGVQSAAAENGDDNGGGG